MTTIRTTLHLTPQARAVLQARGGSLSDAANSILAPYGALKQRLSMRLKIFSPEQLDAIIKEGSAGFARPSIWADNMLESIADIVRSRPGAYMQFGPFWWPIKKMLQDSKRFGGEPVDPEIVAEISTGDAIRDLAAAYAFSQSYPGGGGTFVVETEDGDTIDYVLADDDMAV